MDRELNNWEKMITKSGIEYLAGEPAMLRRRRKVVFGRQPGRDEGERIPIQPMEKMITKADLMIQEPLMSGHIGWEEQDRDDQQMKEWEEK